MKRKAMVDLIHRKWSGVLELLKDNDLIEIHADRLETFKFSWWMNPGGRDCFAEATQFADVGPYQA
jgi:hypothetical protein